MFWQQGTGLSLLVNVMNHLPLIRKTISKKAVLHSAELIMASKSSRVSSAQLNSRLRASSARAKRLHDAELLLAAKPSQCSSAQLNSRIATQLAADKRLHAAQIVSLNKTL